MSGMTPSSEKDGQGWRPDSEPGMAGLLMAMSKQKIAPEQGSSATGSGVKARPSVPQKKSHVEELVRLRKELEEMTRARDQACAERDAMEDDMLKLTEDNEEKDQQLKKMSREVWDLRDKVERSTKLISERKRPTIPSRLSFENGKVVSPPRENGHAKVETELARARQQVQEVTDALTSSEAALAQAKASLEAQSWTRDANSKLKTDLAQARQQAQDVTAALRVSETALADSKASLEAQSVPIDADAKTATDLTQVRQQLHVLTMALVEEKAAHAHSKASLQAQPVSSVPSEVDKKVLADEAQRQSQQKLNEAENFWRSQLNEQQNLREAAERNLHSVKQSHEIEVEEAQRRYREQKQQLEKAEGELHDHSQRMDIDSGNTEELGRLQTLVVEHEGAIRDQQRRVEHFRRMSERLTTQVKQSNMAQRNAEQLEQATKRQLESMKSQTRASQFRQRGAHMPGGY